MEGRRFPDPGASLPLREGCCARLARATARALLRAAGWRIEGALPDLPKAVIVVAPHTSNWDFVIGIAAVFALGVRVAWLGKSSLFTGVLGPLMRRLDGIPVDRSRPGGAVEQAVAAFRRAPRLLLGLSPEGTRTRVERWHRGFSHIASGADVPIVPATFHSCRRAIVLGPALPSAGDPEADLAALRPFFAAAAPFEPEGWQQDFR